MKLSPEELRVVEVLLARNEILSRATDSVLDRTEAKPIAYDELLRRRRARLDALRG
jgi:hypothetical protein